MRVRSYISYSQLDAFEKGLYEERYLKGIKVNNKYQNFGSKFHEAMLKETNDKEIERLKLFLPKYKYKEVTVEATVEKIPLLGVIDGLNTNRREFCDYKTGKKWSQFTADNSDQITFYYLILWKKYGWIASRALIHWIQTTEDDSGNICSTGKIQTFETIRTMKDLMLLFNRVKNAWVGIENICDEAIKNIV